MRITDRGKRCPTPHNPFRSCTQRWVGLYLGYSLLENSLPLTTLLSHTPFSPHLLLISTLLLYVYISLLSLPPTPMQCSAYIHNICIRTCTQPMYIYCTAVYPCTHIELGLPLGSHRTQHASYVIREERLGNIFREP